MTLSLPIKHQNHISNSLPTLMLTTYLTLLILLYLSLVLNVDYLDPNLKILWSPFALVKGEISHNSTLELFR